MLRVEKLGSVLRVIYAGTLGGLAGYFFYAGRVVEGALAVAALSTFLLGSLMAGIETYTNTILTDKLYIVALILLISAVVLLALGKINFTEFMELVMMAINLVLGRSLDALDYLTVRREMGLS